MGAKRRQVWAARSAKMPRIAGLGRWDSMSQVDQDRVIVIAEAGVNHNGSLALALRLVDEAAATGADFVKFQTFRAEALVTAHAPKADYQNRNAPELTSQLEMLKALELDREAHRALIDRCAERGIGFLSTPFDPDSVRLLTEDLKLGMVKVSSGDLTNAPLLLQLARSGVDLVVSTGMATLAEVELALGVLAFGYLDDSDPDLQKFGAAFASAAGRSVLKEKVVLLHCTSDYPAKLADVNLRAMDTLRERFDLRVGYSDHTDGIAIAIAAVARGAVAIEKHLTLDRTLPGPDHAASLEPGDFRSMVSAIRSTSEALGSPIKAPAASEMSTRRVARKAIVAARAIPAGELLSVENLTIKRAGGGLEPIEFWNLVGQPAERAYAADEVIEP